MASFKATHRPVALMYPRGTCRKSTFYTRGDDLFKEPEWTENERRNVKLNYTEARAKYVETKREYEAVTEEWNEAETYTLRLAETMGEESSPTTENARLHQEIDDLNADIADISAEMAEINRKTRINEIAALEKELAAFFPEIEALTLERTTSNDKCADDQMRIAELMTSEEYGLAVDALCERRVACQCRNNLRDYLKGLHKEMDTAPSEGKSKRTASVNAVKDAQIQQRLDDLTEEKLQLTEVDLQMALLKEHKRFMVRSMMARIEEMNDMIRVLGKEGVDIEEVKAKVKWEEMEAEEREIVEKEEEKMRQTNDRPLTVSKGRSVRSSTKSYVNSNSRRQNRTH